MKHPAFSFALGLITVLTISFLLLYGGTSGAEDPCDYDGIGPVVQITSPTPNGVYETDQSTLSIAGEVDEDCAVRSISWSVSGNPPDAGLASAYTSNWVDWSWQATGIPLREGSQTVIITAVDGAGIVGEAALEVTYTPPSQPPEPPPGSAKDLNNKKTKLTFYFGGPDYDNLDRASVVAYLAKEATEVFQMPFGKNVTAVIELSEPGDPSALRQIFIQTIPAGTVSGTTKYRYVGPSPGIREMVFQQSTSTMIYFYLYIENWNFLPDLMASMSVDDYHAYVRSIPACTVTVWIGEDQVWRGEAPLSLGTYSEHKQELVYNR